MAETYTVRPAQRKDCSAIAGLIKELAVFEQLGDKAKLDGTDLERDGFDSNPPYFHCLVAELNNPPAGENSVIGYALYYYTYSTWQGKGIHLEDFYISPKHQAQGLGTKLFNTLAKIGVDGDFCRLTLECLDWNIKARKFYENRNAINYTEVHGWHTYRFVREVMEKLAAE